MREPSSQERMTSHRMVTDTQYRSEHRSVSGNPCTPASRVGSRTWTFTALSALSRYFVFAFRGASPGPSLATVDAHSSLRQGKQASQKVKSQIQGLGQDRLDCLGPPLRAGNSSREDPSVSAWTTAAGGEKKRARNLRINSDVMNWTRFFFFAHLSGYRGELVRLYINLSTVRRRPCPYRPCTRCGIPIPICAVARSVLHTPCDEVHGESRLREGNNRVRDAMTDPTCRAITRQRKKPA